MRSSTLLVFTFLVGNLSAQCEIAKLTGSDTAAYDRFGHSVSVSGSIALVGALGHSHAGLDAGGACIFEFGPTGWVETAELAGLDTAEDDAFGSAVAADGSRVIVSAPWDADGGFGSGSAYVFFRGAVGWAQEAKLLASDPSEWSGFGVSVGISGDAAIVGRYMFSDFGGVLGAAYLYEYDGNVWSEVAKLTAQDALPDDQFGISVAISDGLAVVGAPGSKATQFTGAAYVFERMVNGTWSEVAKLTASTAAPWDNFGQSVAIDAETVLVGAPNSDPVAPDSGAVFVFDRVGGAWLETAILAPSSGAIGDEFGRAVSVSGNRAAIAAPRMDGAGSDSGSAFLFERQAGGWTEVAQLLPSDPAGGDRFGNSLSLSGQVALIGAAANDPETGGGFDSGAAYVFSTGMGSNFCVSSANSTGSPARISLEGCGSIGTNGSQLIAAPVPNQPGLFFYGSGQQMAPLGNGHLCVGDTLHRLDVEVAVGNELRHALDLTSLPPGGQIVAGSTWNFQAWFRDPSAGGAKFDLSDGLRITFAP